MDEDLEEKARRLLGRDYDNAGAIAGDLAEALRRLERLHSASGALLTSDGTEHWERAEAMWQALVDALRAPQERRGSAARAEPGHQGASLGVRSDRPDDLAIVEAMPVRAVVRPAIDHVGVEEWHIECWWAGGAKYAPIVVDGERGDLADWICRELNERAPGGAS